MTIIHLGNKELLAFVDGEGVLFNISAAKRSKKSASTTKFYKSMSTTTTGNSRFAERPTLCRVPGTGTRQRLAFAECHVRYSAKTFFAECFFWHLAKNPLCRLFFYTRQRPSLPSAKKTLDKENFKSNFEAINKFKSKSFEL